MRLDKWLQISKIIYIVAIVVEVFLIILLKNSAFLWLSLIAVSGFLFCLDFKFCRCPHCNMCVRPVTRLFMLNDPVGEHCPHCGEHLYEEKTWCSGFDALNYMHGELHLFEDRAETMCLVTYDDGMLIRVGYDSETDEYMVTALANDSDEAKASPLVLRCMYGRDELLKVLQKTVHDIRDDKI